MAKNAKKIESDIASKEEVTVRSEDYGKDWYINGIKIEFSSLQDRLKLVSEFSSSSRPQFWAGGDTKKKIEVTVVELRC